MTINLTSILFVLIIFQLLFLSCFLFTREKGKRAGNLLLGIFFLSIALNLLDVFLLMTGVYFSYPGLAGWGSCLPLLFGPLLYFYTQSVVYKDFGADGVPPGFILKRWAHFLPFLLLFSVTECYYLFLPRELQEGLLRNLSGQHFPGVVSWVSTLIFGQFLFYIFASLRLVARYKKAASQFFSDRRHTDLSWLYFTLFFFMGILLLATLNGLLARTAAVRYYLLVFNGLIGVLLVFINRILLKTLRQPDFFSFAEDGLEGAAVPGGALGGVPPVKETGEKEKIAQAVVEYMQREKPYLKSELTLDQLAAQLSLKPRLLSQSINEMLGQNFFDFINHYRIEEARRLLTNPKDEKITILEVLYEVGFNSKSSFNTLFKKYTGLTPTEFRKNQSR